MMPGPGGAAWVSPPKIGTARPRRCAGAGRSAFDLYYRLRAFHKFVHAPVLLTASRRRELTAGVAPFAGADGGEPAAVRPGLITDITRAEQGGNRMYKFLGVAVGVILLAGCAAEYAKKAEMKPKMKVSMAHAHMGHVMTSWKDTPDKMGLLPTALLEARIARYHAEVALKRPRNLKWLRTHTWHAVHAVNRSMASTGPGLGYGVRRAAQGAAQHIEFAAKSPNASKNIKLHARHVATSARNAVPRVDAVIMHARMIQAAKTAKAALGHAKKLHALTRAILQGVDANGDGKITWIKGEGGLNHAEKHMIFMQKGEAKAAAAKKKAAKKKAAKK